MTAAERKLWALLRGRQLGRKFRRQHPIDPFVVDFFCVEAGLVVEVDGPYHDDQQTRDEQRDRWLEAHGFIVLHLTNDDVLTRPRETLERIRALLRSGPLPPGEGPDT